MSAPSAALEASRVNLVAVIRGGIPEPSFVPGGEPWLRTGKRYLIPAPAGEGKSLAGLIIAVTVVEHGGTATILDVENGADEYARRLDDVLRARDPDGTLANACEHRLRYHAWPQLSLGWQAADWVAATDSADVVIFDSSRLSLSSVGLAEDKADDYSRFVSRLIVPLAKAGSATIMLDNTGHQDKDRARGTSSKADLNEVVYALKSGAPFDREQRGLLRLVRSRCRFSGLPRELRIQVGGGTYTAPAVADAEPDPRGFRPTVLMERVSLAVEAHPGLSKRAIRETVSGKSDAKDLALELLIADGYIELRTEGQTSRHYSLKPYRDGDHNGDRAPVPQPCPNRAPGTVKSDRAPVPLPKGARERGTVASGPHNGNRAPDNTEADLARLIAKFGDSATAPEISERRS